MYLIEVMSSLGESNTALLFRCVLDRIPILVVGDDEDNIYNLLTELTGLIPFRNEMIYGTDFISPEELEMVGMDEEMNYETARSVFISYPSSSHLIAGKFRSFKSWVIGAVEKDGDDGDINAIKEAIYNTEPFYLLVEIFNNVAEAAINGKVFPSFDLQFEESMIRTVVRGTEDSIARMKRVLSKRIKSKRLDALQVQSLLDFSDESLSIKKNLFEKEVLDFYQAAKRAFYILGRMKMLEDLGIRASLAERTIQEAIAYHEASAKRLIEFINCEWGVQFGAYVKGGRSNNFGDLLESMWG